MHETDAWAELTLADLIADATQVTLPAPRTAPRVIDLTVPSPRSRPQGSLTISDATLSLVDGYADYGV
jgi:hypothetical protein